MRRSFRIIHRGSGRSDKNRQLNFAIEDGFVIFNPHTMFPGNLNGAFEWFCEWVFAAAARLPGRKVLLTDEAWKYCSPQKIPFGLSNCLQTGRKRGLEMFFATQRPNKLNEAILNETTELVCFRLQGNNGLECLADLGVSEEEVANLPLESFVSRNVRSGAEIRGKLF